LFKSYYKYRVLEKQEINNYSFFFPYV